MVIRKSFPGFLSACPETRSNWAGRAINGEGKMMKSLSKIMESIESFVCVAAVIVMTFACGFQVINRNIFHFPLQWTEELARYSMVWLALLGASIGLRQGKQMCMAFVYDRCAANVQRIFRIIGSLVCAVFCGTVGYFSLFTIQRQIEVNQVTSALKIPMGIVYIVIPFSMFVMMIYEIYQLALDVTGKNEQAQSGSGSAGDEIDR